MLALLLAALAMITALAPAGWNLSALARVDSKTKLGAAARVLDPSFHTVHSGAYDGQFYWGIAVDPVATGDLHTAFDKASYRYGHPLYGWLGWLLSAGRARAAPAALATADLVCVFAAAVAAAALGIARGRSGWAGLFVALNPGLIIAARNDLAEPLAVALLLGAFVFYVRGKRAPAWSCLALLPLAKEPLLVVPLAVVICELGKQRGRHAALFATALVPALLWWTYARIHLGAWFTTGDSALGEPLAGWTRALADAEGSSGTSGGLRTAILLVVIVLLVLAGVRALRLRGPVELSYLALAAIAACLAPNATAELTTALRNTAFLLALIPFVVATPALLSRVSETSVHAGR